MSSGALPNSKTCRDLQADRCYKDLFYYNDKVVKPVMFHDCIHRLQRVDRLSKALKYSPDNRYHIEDVFGKSDDHFDYEDEMESIGTSKIGDNDGIKVLLTANEDNFTPHGEVNRFYEEISVSTSIEYLHFASCEILRVVRLTDEIL